MRSAGRLPTPTPDESTPMLSSSWSGRLHPCSTDRTGWAIVHLSAFDVKIMSTLLDGPMSQGGDERDRHL